jgi:lipopolysaccharide transport system ATP-binding protein
MSKTVISIEHLYKEYNLGVINHKTLYRDMQTWWSKIRGKDDPNSLIGEESFKGKNEKFLALNDISLEIQQGDVLGIIGRNGAGKSTLLKILSNVTTPTKGQVKIKGKIASLLEVGTGFHPELTGRENIFLNGAILGMPKKEIARKFDEIVDFSGVEQFIDTPVKRYSSGMYVRLAFAVAAHLEPDILIVDEVLAVGDAEFQDKCLGKMQNVSINEGRTVLFVSHNMTAMERLCKTGVLLQKGMLMQSGPIQQVIGEYIKSDLFYSKEKKWEDISKAPGNNLVRLCSARALNHNGQPSFEYKVTEPLLIEVEFMVLEDNKNFDVHIYFYDEANHPLFMVTDLQDVTWQNKNRKKGLHKSTCEVPANLLNEGIICIMVGICSMPYTTHLIEHNVLVLKIIDDFQNIGARGGITREWPKVAVRPLLNWKFDYKT